MSLGNLVLKYNTGEYMNKVELPKILLEKGFSHEEHIFRYRPDNLLTKKINESTLYQNGFTLDEIENSEIWHSAVGSLNDPFEIYAKANPYEFEQMNEEERFKLWYRAVATKLSPGFLSQSKEAQLKLYKQTQLRFEENIRAFSASDNSFEEIITEIREEVAIASFTSCCNSRLMWGYYCNGLSGLCLIYNKKKLLKNKIELHEIKYIDVAYNFNVYDFAFSYRKPRDIRELSQVLKTKHKEWQHESEFRSIVMLGADEYGRGKILPLNECCIEGVIMGKKSNEVTKIKVRELAKKNKFRVFIADVNYSRFEVEIYQ